MTTRRERIPPWRWWLETGQRLDMGVDVYRVFQRRGSRKGVAQERIMAALRSGQSISNAIAGSGWALPDNYRALLLSGESSGRLGEHFRRIGEDLRRREGLRREIQGNLWYPLLVSAVGAAVMGLLVLWVIPHLREMLGDMVPGESLPWITEHIGAVYGWMLVSVAGLLGLLVAISRLGKALACRWTAMACANERLRAAIPLFGKLRGHQREEALTRQLAVYLQAAVTLPDALNRISAGTDDLWQRAELQRLRAALMYGTDFHQALANCGLIDPDHVALLSAGQQSGKLDQYLESMADQLEASNGWTIRQLLRIYEPVLLLGIAAAVGGLLLAFLLPMIRVFERFTF